MYTYATMVFLKNKIYFITVLGLQKTWDDSTKSSRVINILQTMGGAIINEQISIHWY